jgi:hypothetical protein
MLAKPVLHGKVDGHVLKRVHFKWSHVFILRAMKFSSVAMKLHAVTFKLATSTFKLATLTF